MVQSLDQVWPSCLRPEAQRDKDRDKTWDDVNSAKIIHKIVWFSMDRPWLGHRRRRRKEERGGSRKRRGKRKINDMEILKNVYI